MFRHTAIVAGALALALTGWVTSGAHATAVPSTDDAPAVIDELRLSDAAMGQLRDHWVDQLEATYGDGTWAPMKMTLDDADLALMGLPPKHVLTSHRYAQPTWFDAAGTPHTLGSGKSGSGSGGGTGSGGATAAGPSVAAVAGAGWFGIRPGAWLLTITDQEVGWCSMAHVYGAPGSYQISTAGHCGKVGDTATVIGAVGGHTNFGVTVPVLLDFGKYAKSTGDAGIGKDWALISVDAAYQNLVTPTMAFWGGPIGSYTATGEVVGVTVPSRLPAVPGVALNPDPFLVQGIVHYGHGAGIGAGGTPRAGAAITWRPTYVAWFGAITPGDSGSGSNTATGDSVGSEREAAGINTHIFVDPLLKTGVGWLASTRVTLVTATLANGQLVPYPAPAPGLP
jgi:hypothetical protein